MSKSSKPKSRSLLRRHCDAFIETVAAQGYTSATVDRYKQSVNAFYEQAEACGVVGKRLDENKVVQLREAACESRPVCLRTQAKHQTTRLIEYLTQSGVVKPSVLPTQAPREKLRGDFETYLRTQCGLSDSTIAHHLSLLERFLTFRFGDGLGELNQLTSSDVTEFILQVTAQTRPYRSKTLATHMRSVLKFLFWSGRTKKNLANGIPRMAQPAPCDLPRSLPAEEVQRLIESVRTGGKSGRRNYAMLLLMARLGLRATEVVAIQLDDINWRSGEILVRGKGQLHDRMPLPPDVGASLADYIKHERQGSSRVLFVSQNAPYKPFKDSQIVNSLLRNAFVKTGLKPPKRHVGSHVLRHSLATDMLRHGASLDEIGDVLRHRSRMTTMIYARQDLDALRSIAQEWPQSEKSE